MRRRLTADGSPCLPPQRHRLVLVGGVDMNSKGVLADVWVSDDEGKSWAMVHANAAPGGRAAHGLVASTVCAAA